MGTRVVVAIDLPSLLKSPESLSLCEHNQLDGAGQASLFIYFWYLMYIISGLGTGLNSRTASIN